MLCLHSTKPGKAELVFLKHAWFDQILRFFFTRDSDLLKKGKKNILDRKQAFSKSKSFNSGAYPLH